jgi:hypothetical protein
VRLVMFSALAVLPMTLLGQSISDFPNSSLRAHEWRASNASGSCRLTRQVALESGVISLTIGSPGPPQNDAQKQMAGSYVIFVFSSLILPETIVRVPIEDKLVELQSMPGDTLKSVRVASIPGTSKLIDFVRAGNTLNVILKDQVGTESSVAFDSLGMDVARPMFDACLRATSPNPRLERP